MPKKPSPKATKKSAAVEPPKAAGMWKILEMKKAKQMKMADQHREGHNHQGPAQAVPSARNTRFTKFAGHRRKIG